MHLLIQYLVRQYVGYPWQDKRERENDRGNGKKREREKEGQQESENHQRVFRASCLGPQVRACVASTRFPYSPGANSRRRYTRARVREIAAIRRFRADKAVNYSPLRALSSATNARKLARVRGRLTLIRKISSLGPNGRARNASANHWARRKKKKKYNV